MAEKLYLCDPDKNRACTKETCKFTGGGDCELTTRLECAQTDADGKPLERRNWKEEADNDA